VAHTPPVRPAAPGTTPDPAPGTGRRPRRTWLVLLMGAGAVTLLAGLIWGAVTAMSPRPGHPSPSARPTSAVTLKPSDQAHYQVTGVQVVARRRGVGVRWNPPARASGVIAFIVVAELGGRAQQEHTVGPAGHTAVFAGLQAGRRYCFVVGTVVESAGGQAGTATAPAACRVIR
jgi:hypothetical protein